MKSIKIFGKYIHRLYKFKKSSSFVKDIINTLWGLMSSKNTKKIILEPNKIYDINKMKTINKYNIDPITKKIISFEDLDKEQYFKYNGARIAPFITAYRRKYIYDLLKDKVNDICYIHTDGFIIKNNGKLEQYFGFGDDMGQMKYERIFKKYKTTSKFEIINNVKKIRIS